MRCCRVIALVATASLGLSVSAMAQGRSGGHAMGGPPAGMGPDMGNQGGMAGSMGQMGRGQAGQMGQMGQMGQQGAPSGPKSVSDLLAQNTKLSSQLQSILGSGVSLQQASSGFKNLGLFVAAVHVSKNLNIPFDQLSAAIQKDGNLGKAIRSLKPNLSSSEVKGAVSTAQRQAKEDIRNSKS